MFSVVGGDEILNIGYLIFKAVFLEVDPFVKIENVTQKRDDIG